MILTLKADNKGEGGIFSLYALVRRRRKWLVIPAMLGGAALLADGIITPPITVTSAIEGLRQLDALKNITQVNDHRDRDRHYYFSFLPAAIWYRIHRKAVWSYNGAMVHHAGGAGKCALSG